ncbi:PEP-CTERM sorting domain-containing protein [Roseomonas sp. AR75]|uniref:PEP-CTERM sorting domain-containing protein n=1 Tax=Roseomonas sp. AR75 TaxID=2562311 RepID=UPI00197D1F69|nr:PEP-CTERM sorting domain-containing protein [Roseomonas sp. AR75]
MTHKLLFGAALSVLLSVGAPGAQAGFLGAEFSAFYRFPDLGTVYPFATWAPPSFTVGAGAETVGDVESVTFITADFTDTRLTLVFDTVLTSPTWNAVAFNGPVFTAVAPLGITGVSLNGATTMPGFTAGRVTFTDTEIRVDWNGLSYVDGEVVAIDFAFVPDPVEVPEPASLALLGLALSGLGVVAMRRRRSHAAT